MLRVDAPKSGRRRPRRWLIWLALGSILLVAVLLGLLVPQATTIEIWAGPGAALIDW